MEAAKKSFGDKVLAVVLVGSIFYAVGFIPIIFCRICLSLLSLFSGRWRKVGFPSLSEAGFTGLAMVWVVAAPALFSKADKQFQTYDYELTGTNLVFSKEPSEPSAYLRSNPDTKISLNGAGKNYKVTGNADLSSVVVLDGQQVLSPRQHSDPKQGLVWIGMFIILLGAGGFLTGVFRQH